MTHSQYSWKRKLCQNTTKQRHRLYRNSWLRHRNAYNRASSCETLIDTKKHKPNTFRLSCTSNLIKLRYRPRLLVVGFGDVAHRLATYLGSRVRIVALSRHRPSLLNGVWKKTDLDQRKAGCFPKQGYLGMIYFAPPPSHSYDDPRVRRLLAMLHVEHCVYISTTGVYGHQEGQWIDETHPINPSTERAKRRAAAEHLFRHAGKPRWGSLLTPIKKRYPLQKNMILRTPGIYAPDRLPIERLRTQTPALPESEDVYTNHIHADDLARLVWWTLFKGRSQRIYNACDFTSIKMGDYFDAVAQACALPKPPRLPRSELIKVLSPMQYSFMKESRRLRNYRITTELGFRFRYPDLKSWLNNSSRT